MANADDLLRNGDLDGARAALVEIVRARPEDVPTRMFLFQLLALIGERQKARTQLATMAQLSPEAQMLAVAYGQALDAEEQRLDQLSGKQPVHVHGDAEGWPSMLAQAIGCLARGETAEGEDLRNKAFDVAQDTPGDIDGTRFDWIADSDSRFGPTFEAIIAGRWGLVPFQSVERIESAGVRDLRDLIWFPATIAFRSGQSVAALLPGRYPLTEVRGSVAEKLGRATSWFSQNDQDEGVGQHLLMLSGGEELGLLGLRTVVFD